MSRETIQKVTCDMNFRYRLMQFMSGRYGIDKFFYALFVIAAVLALINCFVHSLILQIIVDVIVVYAFFRALSRNIYARQKENQKFLSLKYKFDNYIATRRSRRADTSHIYRKCPNCKATLRLPRRRGKHTTVCPKCGKEFKVRVYK